MRNEFQRADRTGEMIIEIRGEVGNRNIRHLSFFATRVCFSRAHATFHSVGLHLLFGIVLNN